MIVSFDEHIKDFVLYLRTTVLSSELPGGIFFDKPAMDKLPTSDFGFIAIVSDIPQEQSSKGTIVKKARIGFHVVGGNQSTTPHELYRIKGVVTNLIVDEGPTKIKLNGIHIIDIQESGYISPVFEEMQRPYIVKDYLITYYGI